MNLFARVLLLLVLFGYLLSLIYPINFSADSKKVSFHALKTVALPTIHLHKSEHEKKGVLLANDQNPVSLSFSSTKEKIKISPVKMDTEGRMDVIDDPNRLSWYDTRGFQVNNILISGHRDWNGQKGVLFGMENWNKNKKVTLIMSDRTTRFFRLDSLNVYHQNQVPKEVMSLLEGNNRLTMITCVGEFKEDSGGYQSRVVAIFKEIGR